MQQHQERFWQWPDSARVARPAPAERDLPELETALSCFYGWPRTIHDAARRPSPFSTSFALEELDVCLEDGTRLELICKDLGRAALLPDARRVRPEFLYAPLREIRMYEHVLSGGSAGDGIGTPTCYGTHCDAAADRYLLFLERVNSQKLCHVGEFAVWTRVAHWLGVTHARFAPQVRRIRERVPVIEYDESFYHRWLRRAAANVAHAPARDRDAVARLGDRYGELARTLARLPRTIIHGEFYPANVLIQGLGAGAAAQVRVCPVDWEMAAHGPGLIDLAALISGKWTAEQREAMASAYYDGLVTRQFPSELPSREELLKSLEYCRLHLAVQWVGWSAEWAPPVDQAWDWLREATQVAHGLGWR